MEVKLRIQGMTVELWSEAVIITFNKTSMGWLMKVYDHAIDFWPCIASFYVSGKGTWLFNDTREDVSAVRAAHKKAVW